MLIASTAGLVILNFVFPPKTKAVSRRGDINTRPTTQPDYTTLQPLQSYAGIYKRDLRKPLYDPKPKAVIKVAPVKPKLTIQLLGTVVEPGFTYAILKDSKGKTKFVSVGQSLDGAELKSISAKSITVIFNGEEQILSTKKDG